MRTVFIEPALSQRTRNVIPWISSVRSKPAPVAGAGAVAVGSGKQPKDDGRGDAHHGTLLIDVTSAGSSLSLDCDAVAAPEAGYAVMHLYYSGEPAGYRLKADGGSPERRSHRSVCPTVPQP